MAARAGSRYVNVHGDELAAIHHDSKWMLYRDLLPTPKESGDIESALDDILTVLESQPEFVARTAIEGWGSVGLRFSGRVYRGMDLSFAILHRLAALNLRFSIEVFPHGLG